MNEKVALKAGLFGLILPFVTIPLTGRFRPAWIVYGVSSAAAAALFHWLPPRIHQGLTPARSAAICLLAGGMSASAIWALDRFL